MDRFSDICNGHGFEPFVDCFHIIHRVVQTKTVFEEKHGVWDTMLELTITSPYVDFRVDSNTCTIGDPMPETTLTLCQVNFIPQSGTKYLASVQKSWVHKSIKPDQTSNSAHIASNFWILNLYLILIQLVDKLKFSFLCKLISNIAFICMQL